MKIPGWTVELGDFLRGGLPPWSSSKTRLLIHLGWCVFLIALLYSPICLSGKFRDSTSATRIEYIHSVQDEVPTIKELGFSRVGKTLVSNHAGAAAADVNGDGWTDFLGARYDLPPVLFINQGDGTFQEDGIARGMGTVVDAAAFGAGDLDNDGDQDLFVVPHYGNRYFLLMNDGTGHFTEEAIVRGASVETTVEPHEGYSVGLVDYDLDGYLDVYVCEWGPVGPEELNLHSVLLRNLGIGNPAHFENVTEAAGLLQPPPGIDSQYLFSSAWADFDQDGWTDLYLVADFYSSRMYWNNGDGTFTQATGVSGLGEEEFGMGVAVGDYDRDGDLDIYSTSIFEQYYFDLNGTNHGNKLYQNLGDRNFAEVSVEANVDRAGWGWGAAFIDYDNDADLDLITTNGMDASVLGPTDPYYDALTDQTALLVNNGQGDFEDTSTFAGITDTELGKAVVVLDYDNDGDEDVIITNTFGSPVVYENDASENGREWIRFELEGSLSNRDGIGAVVSVTDGERTQTSLFNPTNAYIGQREAFLHFGLDDAGGTADKVVVRWPSGIVEELQNLDSNSWHLLTEPGIETVPPLFTGDLEGGVFTLGDRLELSVDTLSIPPASYIWEKDGVVLEGVNGPRYTQRRVQPFDAGLYRVRAINPKGQSSSSEVRVAFQVDFEARSVARWWNEFLLEAIRKDFPDPTVHSRNLYHLSAAMWDAFWAYEEDGWSRSQPLFHQEWVDPSEWGASRMASQAQALSYAAYRVAMQRYQNSPGKERSLFGFRWLMEQFGYDPDDETVEGQSPLAVGNRIGFSVVSQALEDGSNEANAYADTSGYEPSNSPLVFDLPGTTLLDPNHWQPLAFDFLITQNGIPIGKAVQEFLGVNWREVDTFALSKPTPNTIGFDTGSPPYMDTESKQDYIDAAVEVIRFSSMLDPVDGVMIDISPGARLNNSLGLNDGEGRSVNPVTGLPYEPNLVKRADYGRVLAEFWADGPASETPPGHWNSLHNEVSDHPDFERRYGGSGEELSRLEWDVRAYLVLNGAMHDAAVAAWTIKRQYDFIRPISIIRYLGGLGQSSDPDGPSYYEQGLPLVDGLIEVVTEESSAPGERHAHLANKLGQIALYCWTGEPEDAENEIGGVDWILAENWMPYQRSTFVTPAFAAYVSGHSTFSRAAAEVMTLLTGSPFFPRGERRVSF